ncbi:MAG: phosphoadenosine phosphosulfate reductase family protein [Lachnospiraceae bacterium]|nr:phosphoadenosine phosphosulfate reductase family protein [Lachnospiraceae bacterium]
MLGQTKFATDGEICDKVELAIKRIKAFEPPEGYYVAFSGGKDSQCVYHLCKMAGVKFDAHYRVTSIDPPELVQFIKSHYPDVKFEHTKDRNGKPITMWTLIPEKGIPPTRLVRYCCEELKESGGAGRFTVTGVRAAESGNRKRNQGVITVPKAGKKFQKTLEEENVNFTQTPRGGVVLNYDNAENRRMTEHCIRTGKALLNPIIDWEEEDVWEFLNGNGIEHCCLYDQGYKRLGCIGCPMNTAAAADLERYPAYKRLYLKAFERMIEVRKQRGLGIEGKWSTPEKVMKWWLEQDDD